MDLQSILQLVPYSAVEGDYNGELSGVAALEQASSTELSFLGNPKYARHVQNSNAGVILVPDTFKLAHPRPGQAHVHCPNPSLALATICRQIEVRLRQPLEKGVNALASVDRSASVDKSASVGAFATVGPGAVIGANTIVGSHCSIGHDVEIGSDCHLHPRVTIYPRCVLKDRVTLHSGTVIGSDGFGYETEDGRHIKVPQIGVVIVESDVEIGANSTVDRARFGATVIGSGTKIDNLVQVGHNVRTGSNCILCAQSGVSGSTTMGNYVILAGQAGVAGHVFLADQSVIGAQAGVHKDTLKATVYRGTPAIESSKANRADVLHAQLPELVRRIRKLENFVTMRAAESTQNNVHP